MQLKKTLNKSELVNHHGLIKLEDCNRELIGNGRVDIEVEGVIFQCFLHVESVDCMFVFLSGNAPRSTDVFQRWSWSSYNTVLAIADPMTTTHGLSLGWYYGDAAKDYRVLASKIILKIASILSIPASEIVIYGSSGGGTAAPYVSSNIPESNCISINPQLDIKKKRVAYEALGKMIGEKTSFQNTELTRNNMSLCIESSVKNRLLFFVNVDSDEDFDEFMPFAKRHGIKLRYGLSGANNVWIFCYRGKPKLTSGGSWAAHNAQDFTSLFPFVIEVLNDIVQGVAKDKQRYYVMVAEIWYDYSRIFSKLQAYEIMNNAYNGDATAQRIFGLMYYTGHDLVKKNLRECVEWLMRAYENGNVKVIDDIRRVLTGKNATEAQGQLALMLKMGNNTAKSIVDMLGDCVSIVGEAVSPKNN